MFPAYKTNNSSENKSNNEVVTFNSTLDTSLVPSTSKLQDISSSSSWDDSDSDDFEEFKEKKNDQVVVVYKKPPPSPKAEIFYIDDEPRKEYLKMDSLPYRCLPLYRLSRRFSLFKRKFDPNSSKFRRYFKVNKKKRKNKDELKLDSTITGENLRIHLSKNPNDLEKWMEFIQYQEQTAKDALQSSEKIFKNKLEAIEKARHFNPANRKLLELYLATLPIVKPTEEVVKIIQDLIFTDQSNLFLWKQYLDNVSSSMSCTAESGLKEHENAINVIKKVHDSDIQMMELFKRTALFLRQAGLMEQFFVIIHLMLSINVNVEVENIFYANNESQNPHLLEFEDLVLQCNLPMPELWFRIETLRSICNFLPVRINDDSQMEDPQRYVFNEDVCQLVNPLRNQKAYNFDLFVMILKLIKYPISYGDVEEREIECGMHFLSVLLLNLPPISENFNKVFYNVLKDVNVSPNFLNFNIEYEPYLECLMKLIEASSKVFNDRQNIILLILWLRLQRLAIKVDQLKSQAEGKTEELNSKSIKKRVKNILKSSKYQNDLKILCEYALIELALGDEKSCFNILNMAIEAAKTDSELNFYQITMEFCELKLIRNCHADCLERLTSLTDGSVLEFLSTKLSELNENESADEIEDFFLPKSLKFELIRAKVFYLALKKSKRAALEEILTQIEKESHIRQKLFELYVLIFHLKFNTEGHLENHRQYMATVARALEEFPKNIFIMHILASHTSLRWFDLRKLLLKTPTNESIFYLYIASKCGEDESKIYQQRIFNTIDGLVERYTIGISSILTWRLYLRAAFNYDFSKCRRILYGALDKYPMVKSFYLDGSRYLSEDLSQLHDLIVEKGIRIHSLIEELEILRSS